MLKWLLAVAVIVIVFGLTVPRPRLKQNQGRVFGKLPGDFSVRWRGRDYFFPFTTTLLLSAVFALIVRLI